MYERTLVTLCVVRRESDRKQFVYQAPSSVYIKVGDTVQLSENPDSVAKVLAANSAFHGDEEYNFVLAARGMKEFPRIYGKVSLTVFEYDNDDPGMEAAVNE